MTDPSPVPEKRHDPYAALRSPNYVLFASGFLCSSTGLRMLSAAIEWEVWQRTNSYMDLGMASLARMLPVLGLALFAGHFADVYSRKAILVCTQIAFTLLAVVIALASWSDANLWVLYGLLVLTGCARVFNGLSRSSLLPSLVAPGDFHNAVTWNAGVFHFSAIAGPLLAGGIIYFAGHAWPVYMTMGVLCATFAVSATFLRPRETPRPHVPFSFNSAVAGIGHLRREKTVLATIALDLFAVLFGGATGLLAPYADEILKVGPIGYGMLRAAPFAGALLMAVIMAHRPPMKHAGRALLWSVAWFGVATIVFGYSKWFWLSIAALAFAGAVDNISVVIRHVLVQVRTPDELRGRVSAVNSIFIESSNELGAFESNLVAKWFGPVASVVSGGVGTILVVVLVAWKWPEIRRLGHLTEEQPPGG